MAYEAIFLERADLLKYQLYRQLVRHHDRELSINDLAKIMQAKYQSVYTVFQEVVDDLQDETGLSIKAIRQGLLTPAPLPMSLDGYRALLVGRSLLFQLIDYAVQTTSPNLETFLATQFISRSTMTRKLSGANRVLKRWGLKFRLTQMQITGPEMSIRYFLYTLYWWAYRGVKWPFTAVCLEDMQAERAALAIMGSNGLSRLQDDYFLAINHLRLSKKFRLADHPLLTELDERVSRHRLRWGEAPATVPKNTVAFFSFFQMSVPRFDAANRQPKVLSRAVSLLQTPETDQVVTAIMNLIAEVQPAPPDVDLRLNLYQLTFGYFLFAAPFPQPQDYLREGDSEVTNPELATKLLQRLAPIVAPAHLDQLDGFVRQVTGLIDPYVEKVLQTRVVRVQLCMAPNQPGYRQLRDFLGSVPWVAEVTAEGDLVIIDDLTPPPADLTAHSQTTIYWVEDAMRLAGFREALVTMIIRVRRELEAAVRQGLPRGEASQLEPPVEYAK